MVQDTLDLLGFSWEDRVTFYLGCSFSFEEALQQAGIEVRNIKEGKNVSIYQTSIQTYPVGKFDCDIFATMRPIPQELLTTVIAITAQFPKAHGAPIHIGDPLRIGIHDLSNPTRGDQTKLEDGEVPVFWACGFTGSLAVHSASKLILRSIYTLLLPHVCMHEAGLSNRFSPSVSLYSLEKLFQQNDLTCLMTPTCDVHRVKLCILAYVYIYTPK